jgi:MFS family permease
MGFEHTRKQKVLHTAKDYGSMLRMYETLQALSPLCSAPVRCICRNVANIGNSTHASMLGYLRSWLPTERSARRAFGVVVAFGIVSLLADVTYEGARSIVGPYMAVLGASAATVGIAAGFGELLGYTVRLLSGVISDRTRKYWLITIGGYAVNLFAVPLLAIAGRWEVAVALMMLERIGKAVRTPARDAMLSQATASIGHGWGFGIHKALDQIGAVAGPLLVSVVLMAAQHNYRAAFAVLAIPAVLAMVALIIARVLYREDVRMADVHTPSLKTNRMGRTFRLYVAGAMLVAAGYVDFPLVAYHCQTHAVLSPDGIPVLYALAMGTEGMVAPLVGRLFDRLGFGVLVLTTALSALFAPMVFLGNAVLVVVGMVLWGIGIGAHESVLRAAIATMTHASERGTAYGIFNTAYGIAWFIGSAVLGLLYQQAVGALVVCSLLVQWAAVPVFLRVARKV